MLEVLILGWLAFLTWYVFDLGRDVLEFMKAANDGFQKLAELEIERRKRENATK